MAQSVQQLASKSSVTGKPSTYYASLYSDNKNPVLLSLENELSHFKSLYKKHEKVKLNPQLGSGKNTNEESHRSTLLFETWNKYETKLPRLFFEEKMLEMGDYLTSAGDYNLALWQCYGRYLKAISDIEVELIKDEETFFNTFFPSGFDTGNAGFTFRALMGKAICTYRVLEAGDPKLQNKDTLARCRELLSFLRLVTQVVLQKERLCWLVYNGTIHIYNLCRRLMMYGYSMMVVEFLIWACSCMEVCIPLLTVKYLPWRTTLYTAVCQCLYDSKAGAEAEAYARRALAKISELSQLESMSSEAQSPKVEAAFREATVKMGTMIFKRSVFEIRRRPRGVLRPKVKVNFKDALQDPQLLASPWPRTQSERYVVEMFDGSSAQFLSILEALSEPNRRILQHGPPVTDAEFELLDVYTELFLAAQEIVAGGGGNTVKYGRLAHNLKPGIQGLMSPLENHSILNLAVQGADGVTLASVVRLLKWAFAYESWDTFDTLVDPILAEIEALENPGQLIVEANTLNLLKALKALHLAKKTRRVQVMGTTGSKSVPGAADVTTGAKGKAAEDKAAQSRQSTRVKKGGPEKPPEPDQTERQGSAGSEKSPRKQDHLKNFTQALLDIVESNLPPASYDMDILMDAVLILWQKCKTVFQKYQTGSKDNTRFLHRMDDPNKWIFVLDVIHRSLGWLGASTVDPGLSAEVVLRLAMVLESSALAYAPEQSSKTPPATVTGGTAAAVIGRPPEEQLIAARDILAIGLASVSEGRHAVATTDGSCIADVVWAKDLNQNLFPQDVEAKQEDPSSNGDTPDSMSNVWNTVKDVQLELLAMYHRVCLKLDQLLESKQQIDTKKSRVFSKQIEESSGSSYKDLVEQCKRNKVSKAILTMQRAAFISTENGKTKEVEDLVKEAETLLTKAMQEEKATYVDNRHALHCKPQVTKLPPAPILLCRTDTSMTLSPAPWQPEGGEKIAWYRLYGRPLKGANIKVRFNDLTLMGTGQEVPSYNCELTASGLTPNEKFLFAVAAFTSDGQMIGGMVGDSTKPILAGHPPSVLGAWAFLSQMAYQADVYDVAKRACTMLWHHFVATPPPPPTDIISTKSKDFNLVYHKLNQEVVKVTSSVLLRQFLTSLFISVEIATIEKKLFCDALSDYGPLYDGQTRRLRECEKMLLALDLAGWLNEPNSALQAVVHIYGLLAPFIHYKLQTKAAVQILNRCMAVLCEIPVGLRQRRGPHATDSLHHMTACITYYISQTLRSWRENKAAALVNEAGKGLLYLQSGGDTTSTTLSTKGASTARTDGGEEEALDHLAETVDLSVDAIKTKKSKKSSKEVDQTNNEELKALEAYLMSFAKQVISPYMFDPKYWNQGQGSGDHELTGNEDPSVLHAYIAFLPSRIAYKEVTKFNRRARYLEFFVQVMSKALSEGNCDVAISWCRDTQSWLDRRNEVMMGGILLGGSIAGDGGPGTGPQTPASGKRGDEGGKKHAVTVMEFAKQKDDGAPAPPPPQKKGQKKKKQKYKDGPPSMKRIDTDKIKAHRASGSNTDVQKQEIDDAETMAKEVLSLYIPELMKKMAKRRRFRQVCSEEMPWRAQLNLVLGLCHFGHFSQKLDLRCRLMDISNMIFKSSYMDQEWFTLNAAGTLIFSWSDPVPGLSTQHSRPPSSDQGKLKRSALTQAALIATGEALKEAQEAADGMDTPRTYRSELAAAKDKQKPEDGLQTLTPQVIQTSLQNTFINLKRAVVLAHRGRHWTTLQNAAKAVWNSANTAVLHLAAASPAQRTVSMETLGSFLWEPFWLASDCLLDMLLDLEEERAKEAEKHRIGVKTGLLVGGPDDESGGASLRFDLDMDESDVVDLRWVRKMVLRALELLYHQEKFEHLVQLALRFNAITNNRYAVEVTPLLIQSQHRLVDRVIEAGDESLSGQAMFQSALDAIGESRPTAAVYSRLQLRVTGLLVKEKHDEEESTTKVLHPDPRQAAVEPPAPSLAQRLCSVPLDIETSLEEFRTALDLAPYTSRALRHCRRLLLLYLAGQQSAPGQGATRVPGMSREVGFLPRTARPQIPVPLDLRREEFKHEDDVRGTPLPKAQLGVVVEAYEKTIELLLSKKHKSLAAQAMRELGALFYHTNNRKAAYSHWCDCLDLILGVKDAIHHWREVAGQNEENITEALIDRCGLWGCLLAGVVASSIAQYILSSDLGLKIECCFLAGCLFKAMFRSTLPHPLANRDYACFDLGEGCEVTCLLPGINLVSDRFRCDARALEAALGYVTEELARAGHDLFVLPLLSLYLYIVSQLCRDLGRSVAGRILRLRVLTRLGLYEEAVRTLIQLLWGDRLPQPGDARFRQLEVPVPDFKLDTRRPLLDPVNLKLMDRLLTKRLPSSLSSLYGPHLTCRLSVAHADLLVALADTVQALPVYPDTSAVPVDMNVSSDTPAPPPPPTKKITKKASVMSVEEEHPSLVNNVNSRLQEENKSITEEMVKGMLLKTSSDMLQSISDAILDAAAMDDPDCKLMSASELHLVVECMLGLGRSARCRHHARTGARFIQKAMRLLSTSKVMQHGTKAGEDEYAAKQQKSKTKEAYRQPPIENFLEELENFKSRGQLDFRLWLTCRYELALCLLSEVRGMGDVKGATRTVLVDIPDTRPTCMAGVVEAEACGDPEMNASFLYLLGQLSLMEGRPLRQAADLFQEVANILHSLDNISSIGLALKSSVAVQLVDLSLMIEPSTKKLPEALEEYQRIQMNILTQMESLGECVEIQPACAILSTLVAPVRNLYLSLLPTLVHVKLRIGHTMALMAAAGQFKSRVKGDLGPWIKPLGVLSTALELSYVMVARSPPLEAELLLIIGKIQRQLLQAGHLDMKTVSRTLVEGIKLTFHCHCDLGLLRQFYLELALTFLVQCGRATVERDGSVRPVLPASDGTSVRSSSASGTESGRPDKRKPALTAAQKKAQTKKEREEQKEQEVNEIQILRRAAWLAIRCASMVADSERALIGLHSDSGHVIDDAERENLPEFAAFDLVSSYALGYKRILFANEIEEELGTMPESQPVQDSDIYDDQVSRVHDAAEGLTWTTLIGYHSLLGRLCLNRGVHVNGEEEETTSESIEGFEFQLVLPTVEKALGCRLVVRTPLTSAYWCQRLTGITGFLSENFTAFRARCVGAYPPDQLQLDLNPLNVAEETFEKLERKDDPVYKTYRTNWARVASADSRGRKEGTESLAPPAPSTMVLNIVQAAGLDVTERSAPVPPPPRMPGLREGGPRNEQPLLATSEADLCVQPYRPALDPATACEGSDRSLLLCASTKKVDKNTSWTVAIECGLSAVSSAELLRLSGRLRMLAQQAELLASGKEPESKPSPQTKATKGKPGAGEKGAVARQRTMSPPQRPSKLELSVETLLRQCLDDLLILVGASTVDQPRYSVHPDGTTLSPDVEGDKLSETEKLPELPFECTKGNLAQFKNLLDPQGGGLVKTSKAQEFLRALLMEE